MRNTTRQFVTVLLAYSFANAAFAMSNEEMEALSEQYLNSTPSQKSAILRSHSAPEMANVLVLVDIKHIKREAYLLDQIDSCKANERDHRR